MARRKRRNHNASFKAKVAVEALKGNRTIAQIADEFGLHSNQVTAWKKQLLEGSISLFETGKKESKPEPSEDVGALKAKVGELTMELDWLKKNPRAGFHKGANRGGGGTIGALPFQPPQAL